VPERALPHAYPRTTRDGDSEFLPLCGGSPGSCLPMCGCSTSTVPQRVSTAVLALRRHYVYRLSTARTVLRPQEARYVTAWPRPLDVDAMATASRDLLGLERLRRFLRHRDGATTIRDLQRWTGPATATASPPM